jgi:heterodisulfide reductase subunit A
VGGGIAGLTTAALLAENLIPVVIVEQSEHLGGYAAQWPCMATTRCRQCFACAVYDVLARVNGNPRIHVKTGCQLQSAARSSNRVKSLTIRHNSGDTEDIQEPAAIVVAAGFSPYDPSAKVFWGYGQLPGVVTLAEVDSYLRADKLDEFARDLGEEARIAFFQCVGSRDASIGANYCSQYCCKAALRLSLRLKHERPGWDLTIFYIDLQHSAKNGGALLADARNQGVHIIQGVPGEVFASDDARLAVRRDADGRNLVEYFDRVILSVGQRPAPALTQLAEILGIEQDAFGYLAYLDSMNTSRSSLPGIYIAGCACGPMGIEETIHHSGQTAAAILTDFRQTAA